MTRIDAAALNAILKSQLDAGSRAAVGVGGGPTANQRPAQTKEQAKAGVSPAMTPDPQLLRRVREISEKDPERRRKVFRLFLESVLAQQLGAGLESDPQLSRIVSRVEEQIRSDLELRQSSDVAAEFLIGQAFSNRERPKT